MEKYFFADYLFSIICNLIAAALFTGLLYTLLRPNLKLSKQILRRQNYNYGDTLFSFKIVNRSLFEAYNLSFELYVRKQSLHDSEHYNVVINDLKLVTKELKLMKPYKPFNRSKFAEYAIIINTNEDLQALLQNDDTSIELVVHSTHGLTAFSKVFRQEYYGENSIANKRGFKYGKSVDIE